MEKVVNSYESVFVVDVAAGETEAKATLDKFTALIANSAEIVEVSEWGKRRLAYPINDKNEGYYTVVTFKSESAFPAELERLLNIDENVMRSIVVKLDHEAVAKAADAGVAEEATEVAEEATAGAEAAEEAKETEEVAE